MMEEKKKKKKKSRNEHDESLASCINAQILCQPSGLRMANDCAQKYNEEAEAGDGPEGEHCPQADAIPFTIPFAFGPKGIAESWKEGKETNYTPASKYSDNIIKQIIHKTVYLMFTFMYFFFLLA